MGDQFLFGDTCRRALSALPEELSTDGPIFDRPCESKLHYGSEVQWCRLVFRTLHDVGSYVRNFESGTHPITYLTIGLSEASVRTIDMLLHRAAKTKPLAEPSGRKGKKKKKRGAKRQYDPKEDQKIAIAWKNGNGGYCDLYELAKAFDMTHKVVKDTLGRVRYHKRKRRKKREK